MNVKNNKSIKEWIIEDILNDFRAWGGAWRGVVIGFAFGYLISYVFQPAFIIRAGFGDYIGEVFDTLFSFEDQMSAEIAVTAWISMFVMATIGGYCEMLLVKKGKIKAWKRKKQDEP